ncbi:PQQ-dependent sugar dehydrogenase [Candidatus Microgenomates bacterium]|jgi:glucose/arabinose dehydrogenase|nr:MAG: PQQ-dependent sugar dehydrogenase [Candidatus Microgenomates bacterium]
MKRALIVFGIIIAFLAFFFLTRNQPTNTVKDSSKDSLPENKQSLSVFTENLEVPWEIVFLPNENALVTERPGKVRLIENGVLRPNPVVSISEVEAIGEGGLLGMALHPDFKDNSYVYLYYTYQSRGNIRNKVARFAFDGNSLVFERNIIEEIPGSNFHNGGRILFGPDKLLYITTGDAQNPALAQNTSSLAGKILRISDEGDTPADNPFGNEVFSYGHRNPQGLAFDENNILWATEHGPSARDEINRIEKGGNYGWPEVTGSEERNGVISPVVQSGGNTWAPSGMTFYNNFLYFTGLRGQALFRFNKETKEITEVLLNGFGRLRTIVLGPNGHFYITTNNKDGRGIPGPGDDKIIQALPDSLN